MYAKLLKILQIIHKTHKKENEAAAICWQPPHFVCFAYCYLSASVLLHVHKVQLAYCRNDSGTLHVLRSDASLHGRVDSLKSLHGYI